MSHAVLQRLRGEKQACLDFVARTLDQAETGQRDLSDTEQETLKAQRERIGQLDPQIAQLEEFEQIRSQDRQTAETYRAAASGQQSQAPAGGQQRQSATYTEPRPTEYRTAGEFLADGWKAKNRSDQGALDRLAGAGVRLEGGQLVRAALPHTTTAETPGLLPVPIVGEIMRNIDAARPFISSIGAKDLGGIPGSSFKRPYVSGSVTVGKQTAEKTEVSQGQFKVDSVTFSKDTYGGWTNVSRQDIDWTSPGVWDALLTDFMEIYGIKTEQAAATAFSTAVTAVTGTKAAVVASPTMNELVRGLYQAASAAYQGAGRLPDGIWVSLDQWALIGPLIDTLKLNSNGTGGGDSSISSFTGNLLDVPRVVVPSLPAGSIIVGVKSRTEVYEDRIGFLSAVEPRVLGVELAYGGYMACGTLKPSAFAKVTFSTTGV